MSTVPMPPPRTFTPPADATRRDLLEGTNLAGGEAELGALRADHEERVPALRERPGTNAGTLSVSVVPIPR